eukprot:CAMPEP_0180754494 /NCGR_PEP_ID=MMETSP1038_2-20121128/33222_1 /TAXON_ID=632150 /ORGANISM="Azadinium spinosum, Strain 3D9" /LENGTH=675 /DNA_ID=CAMNT_0022788403 /DNA_START=42 /DNA_END=2069 /DNA_ORIENTATION=-
MAATATSWRMMWPSMRGRSNCTHHADVRHQKSVVFQDNPNGGAFIEYFQGLLRQGRSLLIPINEGTSGAPWPLMTYWSAVPHDECLYHDANGYSGEYTFRYERTEIKCAHSDWQPDSGPRISQDGGVCGRLSYLARIKFTCSGAPSAGMGQPGHAAGWMYEKDASGQWIWGKSWSIYDERVSWTPWNFALTEDQWGRSMAHGGKTSRRPNANAQWLKTVAASMNAQDGLRKYEKARIAAMTALQASYWGDVAGDTWLHRALEYNAQDIEIWELFRLRIEQGNYDLQKVLGLWADFKQAMVLDATTSYHKLAETFFYSVAGQRTCSSEVMSWLKEETATLFRTWRSKGFEFDYTAEEAIFIFKQIECNLLINGWSNTISHTTYGHLIDAILKDEYGQALNLEGEPYGSGVGAVKSVINTYIDSVSTSAKKMEPLQWVMGHCRPGLITWNFPPFGQSYFYWFQFERVEVSPSWTFLMESWILPKMTSFGSAERSNQITEWAESCLTTPWNHTHNNTRHEMYDGCYYGKDSDFSAVIHFMTWILPFHASGWKDDAMFPEQTLKWLRASGAALLQTENASSSGISASLTQACLADPNADSSCPNIIALVKGDVESGREERADGGAYDTPEEDISSSIANDGSEAAVPTSISQLSSSMQHRFQEAYRAFVKDRTSSTPFD